MTAKDVVLVAAVASASAIVVFVRYRQFLFSTFDPEVAEVSGVSTAWIDLLLALILASTITVTMTVVGVTMIAAMLVIPPVIARLLTDSFHRMLWISVVTGAVCGFVGVYLSYYLDWPSGPTVVLTAAVAVRRRLPRLEPAQPQAAARCGLRHALACRGGAVLAQSR